MKPDQHLQANALRARFRREGADAENLGKDPIAAFRRWHADWVATSPFDPALMTVATVDERGRPTVRAMNLLAVDHGFIFMSHKLSPKALDLQARPDAALCFVWPEIGRQIRIGGPVMSITDTEADAAFSVLPRSFRLIANATRQSEAVNNRDTIKRKLTITLAELCGRDPTRPESWLGLRLLPIEIEFWQQRQEDLHDRIVFNRKKYADEWNIIRISP